MVLVATTGSGGGVTATAMERNGRRSRGPSPNNNNGVAGTSPETSSDDENSSKKMGKTVKKSEYEEKIRVGRDYQAVCPELVPSPERKPDALNDRALLVWSPTKDIADTKLEEYISVAKEKYGYNGEQALGMLFWHKHDLERAVMDLANFTPFPDEWTIEDKVLFEQAFQFHGKSFHRIRQMLPDKSISSLVKFYYSWKKTRNRTSVMDRQEKVKKADGSENGSEHGSNEDSDNEEKIQQNKQNVGSLKRKNSDASDDLRPNDLNGNGAKMSSRWSTEEVLLVVQGIKKYGKDFQAIAETIGTKSAAQVRLFFTNHKRKYDLDGAMKEFYEQQQLMSQEINGNKPITINDDIMEIDLDDEDSNDGAKSVSQEKRETLDGPLILPEGVNMSEITITKAAPEPTSIMSSLVTKSVNGSGGAAEKNGTKGSESVEKESSSNNNNNNNGKSATSTSTVTVDDDDDVVLEETTKPAATAATQPPTPAAAPTAPPPPLKSIPAAIK